MSNQPQPLDITDLQEDQIRRSLESGISLERMRFDDFWSIWDTLSTDAKSLAAKSIYEEVQILDDDTDKMTYLYLNALPPRNSAA